MRAKEYMDEVETEGVEVKLEGTLVTLKGEKGEVSREFRNPKVKIEFVDGKVQFKAKNATKREKTMIGTFKSHLKNMVKGAKEGHVYRLKICSGHFPMNVSINNNVLSVKNYLGEKTPRTVNIKQGVTVKIDGDFIQVESISKELAGQTAADIEQLTRITDRDRNKFQDGIYIINKDGKEI
ncbi:50S ribosomal protein L6 [Candidatus Woesearchaeota archaeon]|nr:50S ribosomal protein L6 [Candidatus Woesearchaeota archaeon]MBW3021514.1 50S ribosomal protein L6 [Candidatus Woesearchaeota archaeon]